jgi:hypothetical protein
MPYAVDFSTVSTVGLESSPVAAALAGLRANEARDVQSGAALIRLAIGRPGRGW